MSIVLVVSILTWMAAAVFSVREARRTSRSATFGCC